jgi:phosphomannomutase
MPDIEHFEELARLWLQQDPDPITAQELSELKSKAEAGDEASYAAIADMFCGRLTFGTAGIRGPLGAGPRAMNRVVVTQTTAGLAQFLVGRSNPPSHSPRVIVGYDARKNSAVFARDTAEVLAGHGIEVFLTPEEVPTPIVAFAVRHLSCDAGVMITASHNPPQDNGYKVYLGGENEGSQIIPPMDADIESEIETIAAKLSFDDIPRSNALIRSTPADLVETYISRTVCAVSPVDNPDSSPIFVYTPMHGVGGQVFLSAVEQAGFTAPVTVREQFEPDSDFPTVAFPNPEEPGALDLSYTKARAVDADLVIAHDPDADRLAVAVPDSARYEGFRALTGNQVGAILGWHLAERARHHGRSGTLANSLVSSPVLGKIAMHFGLLHQETLTGFKYVSRIENLIFGFEEALGYLVTPEVVKDKDGISAGLLVMSLAISLSKQRKTLTDYLHEIENHVGAFASSQVTVNLKNGVSGSTIMNALRERSITTIGSRLVVREDDFFEGVGQYPTEDILRFYLDDGTRVIARPSGTEPKVKVYIDTEGTSSAQARSRVAEVESDINDLISALE